jgi:hypothetical protein
MSVFQPGNVAYGFSQALLGVQGAPIIAQRAPTVNDKAQIGSLWIDQPTNTPYILTSIVDNIATWVNTSSSVDANTFDTDAGVAVPAAGVIVIHGGSNINTAGATNVVTVNLNNSIALPATNSMGTSGVIYIGGSPFLYAFPQANTFVGNAGSFSLNTGLAINNVAVGNDALGMITTGPSNTAIGSGALSVETTGTGNTAVGFGALENLITGQYNIGVGTVTGSNYVGAESSNILIGSLGVAAESNTIRIGIQGSGAGEQNTCYIAGITGVSVANENIVTIDTATGQLGSIAVPPSGIITLDGNSGSATGSTVTVEGGNNITTSGAGSTLTVNVSGTTDTSLLLGNGTGSISSLGAATDGQLPIGSTGVNPVLAALTAGTGINITNGAGSITIDSTVTSGIVTIDGDTGSVTGATVKISGTTSGSSVSFVASGTTLDLDVTDIHENTFIGELAGNGAVAGTNNTGVGYDVFPSISAGTNNTGVGWQACHSIVNGANNTAFGYGALGAADPGQTTAIGALALGSITGGLHNVAVGYNSGTAYTGTESDNILIGTDVTGTLGESGVIRIGVEGTQTECFIAGISGVVVANTNMVTIDTVTGQMGSATLPSSGITTLAGDTGSATGATVTIETLPGTNGGTLNFSGSGATLTLNTTSAGHTVSLGKFTTSTSANCVLIGYGAGQDGAGDDCTAVGFGALSMLNGGTGNTCLGYLAGNQYTSNESYNICLGFGASGTTGESNTIRIGFQGTQTACYIAGIYGETVGGSGTPVVVDNTGLLGTVVSSRRYKELIADMDAASDPILNLHPVTFVYKNDTSRAKQFGLIAEEVEETMPELVSYNKNGDPETVHYHTLPVLLLNHIQKQHNIIAELTRRVERLETRSKYESKS